MDQVIPQDGSCLGGFLLGKMDLLKRSLVGRKPLKTCYLMHLLLCDQLPQNVEVCREM